jgi:tetratricopeptide (TPR) repeat protein
MLIYPRFAVDPAVWWQYVPAVALILVAVVLWRSQRLLGRGPLLAAAWFAISLSPTLGLVFFDRMEFSHVADHFQYLPSIGLIALGGALLTQGIERLDGRRRSIAVGSTAAMVAVCGIATWRHTRVYRNDETIWRDTLAQNPQSWVARFNLGTALLEQRQLGEAAAQLGAAVETSARERRGMTDAETAAAHNNWGLALQGQRKFDEAIEHYAAAVQIKPDFAEARINLAKARATQGRTDEAIQALHDTLRISPACAEAHNALGAILSAQGKLDEAAEQFAAATRLQTDFADAYGNWGLVLSMQGKLDEAIEKYATAVRLDPAQSAPHYNLALALVQKGNIDEAVKHFAETARLRPNFGEVHNQWGNALEAQGKIREAIEHYLAALQINADDLHAMSNWQRAEWKRQTEHGPGS